MNGDDLFEARLKRQPPRPLPASWRREILAATQASEAAKPSLWASLLWPHPRAWAALGAVWLVVFALNFVARDKSTDQRGQEIAFRSPEIRELLHKQEKLMAELAGPGEERVMMTPRRKVAQPRSQRREEFRNA